MAVPVSDSPAWTVYCDGSAVPNPGRMGLGAMLIAPDGTRHALSRATHSVGCNNEAELRALTDALLAARAQGALAVQVYSDNSVLVEQLGGRVVKPIERLADLFDEARALLGSFERVALQWIPRHRNGEADALARAALGMAPKPGAKPRGKAGRRHQARAIRRDGAGTARSPTASDRRS